MGRGKRRKKRRTGRYWRRGGDEGEEDEGADEDKRQEDHGGGRYKMNHLIPIFKKFSFYTFFSNPGEWVLVISLRPSCVHLTIFEIPFLKTMVFNLFVCLFENTLSKIKWEKNLHIGNSVTAAWPLWISMSPRSCPWATCLSPAGSRACMSTALWVTCSYPCKLGVRGLCSWRSTGRSKIPEMHMGQDWLLKRKLSKQFH